ncbi:aminopeptidase P family protein [Staphylococcus condimenti]|uniref:Aminopeptidase P family protein n=1 Tax=Staphylococcus condimenti TaxID=70255 RepID=A0A143P852_9STAP|nr:MULTISPECIES: aminopeptidase P family protein [Staphylococcus]AMY04701.1 peptidase M24 [Staphylococcus condimenti]APR60943.1 peptidase M24 family protein [Staphylococcus condimenti]MDK8643971.1 aminopeptidase P family protein [Staphylococcus condimenti]OFP01459.1 peptidase M24 [Staphylococcus sp. HMSC065E08]PNZ60882.1 aminopeptidase P family protein [Staphylococcus condimenti]
MSKVDKLRYLFSEKNLDAIIVLSDYNRRYISGFTGTSGALVITPINNYLVTDFRYIDQASDQAPDFEIIKRSKGLVPEVIEVLKQLDVQKVGFEGHLVSYDTYTELNQDNVSFESISDAIEDIRAIKDQEEINTIKKAAEIVDKTYEYILSIAKVGMTEQELKAELESKMLRLGASGPSFDTIVASGYRGALPHGVASDKKIEEGDMITLDFGAYYNGYVSDITRTFAIGQPDPKLIEIYNIVLEAQQTAVNKIKAGMTGEEADAIARDIIENYGYGEYFGHSTGHGIGLEIHEKPMLAKTAKTKLVPNNCVTVEPGIYIEGLGGVRIEDDIIITENGNEVFTKCTKDLIIL